MDEVESTNMGCDTSSVETNGAGLNDLELLLDVEEFSCFWIFLFAYLLEDVRFLELLAMFSSSMVMLVSNMCSRQMKMCKCVLFKGNFRSGLPSNLKFELRWNILGWRDIY